MAGIMISATEPSDARNGRLHANQNKPDRILGRITGYRRCVRRQIGARGLKCKR